MKKSLSLLLMIGLLCIAALANAQTTPSDSTALKPYTGTYTFGDASPVRKYIVTMKNGELFGAADDLGTNKLMKKEGSDVYQSTSSYGSVITFTRDVATKAVTGFNMAVQGTELNAKKEKP